MKIFNWFKKKQQKKKLKYKIEVTQSQNNLKVAGVFNRENYNAKELWLQSRTLEFRHQISEIDPTNNFEFNISLMN